MEVTFFQNNFFLCVQEQISCIHEFFLEKRSLEI